MASGEAVDEVCKLWVESAAAKVRIRRCKVGDPDCRPLPRSATLYSTFGVRFCSDSVGGRGAVFFHLSENMRFCIRSDIVGMF